MRKYVIVLLDKVCEFTTVFILLGLLIYIASGFIEGIITGIISIAFALAIFVMWSSILTRIADKYGDELSDRR